MNKQWEKDIREKLAAHEEPTPELSWTEIDTALKDHREKTHSPTIYMWPRRIAAAAAVALIVVGGVKLLTTNSTNEGDNSSYTQTKAIPTPSQPVLPMSAAPQPTLLASAASAPRTLSEPASRIKVSEATPDTLPALPATNPVSSEQPTAPKTTGKKKTSLEQPDLPALSTSHATHGLTAQAWLGGTTASTYGSEGSLVMVGADAPFANYEGNSLKNEVELPTPPPTPSLTKTNHHTPLRLGLGLRYALGSRWSLAAGVTYTRLTSDLGYDDGSEARQTLHYIGIPLQVSYALYRTRRTHLYVSLGGEAQRMISGRRSFTTPLFGAEDSEDESLHSSALQLSATAAVGVEYSLASKVAVYAEPGLGYSFDNGSDLPTLYKDRPLNFNLNVGLRVRIK